MVYATGVFLWKKRLNLTKEKLMWPSHVSIEVLEILGKDIKYFFNNVFKVSVQQSFIILKHC